MDVVRPQAGERPTMTRMRISRWSTTSRAKATRVTMTYSRPPSSPSSQAWAPSKRMARVATAEVAAAEAMLR